MGLNQGIATSVLSFAVSEDNYKTLTTVMHKADVDNGTAAKRQGKQDDELLNDNKDTSCRAIVPYQKANAMIVPHTAVVTAKNHPHNKLTVQRFETAILLMQHADIAIGMASPHYHNGCRDKDTINSATGMFQNNAHAKHNIHNTGLVVYNVAPVQSSMACHYSCGCHDDDPSDEEVSHHKNDHDWCHYFDDDWSTTSTLTANSWDSDHSCDSDTDDDDDDDDSWSVASKHTVDLKDSTASLEEDPTAADDDEEEEGDDSSTTSTLTKDSSWALPVFATSNPWAKDNLVDVYFGTWNNIDAATKEEDDKVDALLFGIVLGTSDESCAWNEQVQHGGEMLDGSLVDDCFATKTTNPWGGEGAIPSLAFLLG